MLLMAYLDKNELQSDKWYLNSRCSNHMCGNKTLFSYLDETYKDTMKLGDNSCIFVMGKGNIKFHMKDNTMQTISSLLYSRTEE